MFKTLLIGAVTAVAVPVLGLAVPAGAATGSVNPDHAACGRAGPNIDNHRVNDAPSQGAAQQRSGSSTSCAALGVLQPTDDAIYFCWTHGNDGFTWTYLQNIRTGVRGWTRDNLLDQNGAVSNCGF